jgi:predicted GNAT family acetyltransferase
MIKSSQLQIIKFITSELDNQTFEGLIDILYESECDYFDPVTPPDRKLSVLEANAPPWPDSITHRYLLKLENKVIGYGYYYYSTLSNKNFSTINVIIKKENRSKGYAKILLKHILNDLPDFITKIALFTKEEQVKSPYTKTLDQYLVDLNGKLAIRERRSGSKIKTFDPSNVKQLALNLKEKAEEQGYRLYFLKMKDFINHTEIDYAKYVKMLEQIWNDMPREESELEDSVLTIEMHQDFFRRAEFLQESIWTFVVTDEKSNPVGMTETGVGPLFPALAYQGDTGVVHEHRGKGLGRMLKYQMLDKLLTDPLSLSVEWWCTHNAGSNSHMLKINDELGYETLAYYNRYEFNKIDLKAKLN